MISPEALQPGRYTLTELKLIRERWKSPSGRVLPVIVQPTPLDQVPAYLRSVTLLEPEGNLTAEVMAAVARHRTRRRTAQAKLTLASLGTGALVALAIWGFLRQSPSRERTRQERIEQTSHFLMLLGSEGATAARAALLAREREMSPRFSEVLGDKSLSRADKTAAFYDLVVNEVVAPGTDRSLEPHFFRLLEFLEEGAACAEQGHCDAEWIRHNPGDWGTAFVHTYGPYICHLREMKRDREIARTVERFYNPGAGDMCAGYRAALSARTPQAATSSSTHSLESSDVSR